MAQTRRPQRGKKLLVAALGVGVLSFGYCKGKTEGPEVSGNLLPPPSCDVDPDSFYCRDMRPADGGADAGDMTARD